MSGGQSDPSHSPDLRLHTGTCAKSLDRPDRRQTDRGRGIGRFGGCSIWRGDNIGLNLYHIVRRGKDNYSALCPLSERVAEGVVVVGVGDAACKARQLAYASESVVAVEAGRPCALDLLVLADALQAVGVGALEHAVDRLLEDLRQAGRVHIVLYQIRRRHVAHLLCYAVAEGVVDHCNRAAVHRYKMVLRVVGEALAAGGERVAVCVVGLWREPVVEVEAVEADRLHAGQRGVDRGAVANRVERVFDLAVRARRVLDGLAGEPVDAVVVPGERAVICSVAPVRLPVAPSC